MLPLDLYQGIESAWCPGCGNFGMLKAFKQALATQDFMQPRNAATKTVGGIKERRIGICDF